MNPRLLLAILTELSETYPEAFSLLSFGRTIVIDKSREKEVLAVFKKFGTWTDFFQQNVSPILVDAGFSIVEKHDEDLSPSETAYKLPDDFDVNALRNAIK